MWIEFLYTITNSHGNWKQVKCIIHYFHYSEWSSYLSTIKFLISCLLWYWLGKLFCGLHIYYYYGFTIFVGLDLISWSSIWKKNLLSRVAVPMLSRPVKTDHVSSHNIQLNFLLYSFWIHIPSDKCSVFFCTIYGTPFQLISYFAFYLFFFRKDLYMYPWHNPIKFPFP